eukprot:829162-Rhodomonas_salina.1
MSRSGSFQNLPPIGVKLILDQSFDTIPSLWSPRLGKDGVWLVKMAEEMVADALGLNSLRVRVANELKSTNAININILNDVTNEDERSPMQLVSIMCPIMLCLGDVISIFLASSASDIALLCLVFGSEAFLCSHPLLTSTLADQNDG